MIGLSNMKDLLAVEEFIYGETLSNALTTFGESLKETEYNKIYKYKGKYFKAYRYLKRDSGIYVPDPNFFMELNLGELSSVYNKYEELPEEESGEFYLGNTYEFGFYPDDNSNAKFFRPIVKEQDNVFINKDIYREGYKSEVYKNAMVVKKIFKESYTIDYSTGEYKDSNSEVINQDEYVTIGDADNAGYSSGKFAIRWLDKHIKVTKTVKEPILEEVHEGSSWWWWLLLPIGVAATVATAGAALPVIFAAGTAATAGAITIATIGSVITYNGKKYKVTGYRDKEVTTDEVVKRRYVVDSDGNIIRELKDGETVDNVDSKTLHKYVLPSIPGGE